MLWGKQIVKFSPKSRELRTSKAIPKNMVTELTLLFIRKGAKDLNRHFSRKVNTWPISTSEDLSMTSL